MKKEKVSIREITIDYIKKRAENEMSPDLIPGIVAKREEILKKSETDILKYFRNDIELFLDMLEFYEKGEYTSIPFNTLSMLMFALEYILEEQDIIIDSIPCSGFLDDAIVMLYTLSEVKGEISRFEEWRKFRLS